LLSVVANPLLSFVVSDQVLKHKLTARLIHLELTANIWGYDSAICLWLILWHCQYIRFCSVCCRITGEWRIERGL